MNFEEKASCLPEATTAYMWELISEMAAALDALLNTNPITEKPNSDPLPEEPK